MQGRRSEMGGILSVVISVIGHWGHWSLVIGVIGVIGHWSLVIGHWGHWSLVIGSLVIRVIESFRYFAISFKPSDY